MWLDAPVKRYALGDLPAMPYAQSLEDMVYPNAETITERVLELARY